MYFVFVFTMAAFPLHQVIQSALEQHSRHKASTVFDVAVARHRNVKGLTVVYDIVAAYGERGK